MPLTYDEKSQADALARGMLIAQRDNLSLAGNLISNPHFANIAHPVKLEALREYARLENEDPHRTTVNIEPDRAEVAKRIAKSALVEGAISLPVSAVIGTIGASKNYATRLKTNPAAMHFGDTVLGIRPDRLKTHLGRLTPIALSLFAANALVGGIREGIRQKANLQEARSSNRYLDQIRGSSSDADLNAMLFASGPQYGAGQAALKASLGRVDKATGLARAYDIPIMGDSYYENPEDSYPARKIVEWGDVGEEDIKEFGARTKQASINPFNLHKQSSKPPKLKDFSNSILNNAVTPVEFKAESAKIRSEQIVNYDTSVKHGLADDKDAQYRLGKAMAKKFLRL